MTPAEVIAQVIDRFWWKTPGDVAEHVEAKLSEHGYSIEPVSDVKSVRLVAEYALHLRQQGEHAPGGEETWEKFDHFAEAVLRATGPTAAEENTNG